MLFTAFEPSGDAHAAPVIEELRRRRPNLQIFAWGGPKMAASGAEVIETTGANAVMGANALAKIGEHMAINRRVRAWLRDTPEGQRVRLHVPVDSPAANFPICKITREHGCRIYHLVAPQMWAWGSWRVRKLRRLTDHVMCLLPFEPAFFEPRGVRATFIGHPRMARPVLRERPAAAAVASGIHNRDPNSRNAAGDLPVDTSPPLPTRHPRLLVVPGSRPAEIDQVLPLMCRVLQSLRTQHGTMPALALPAASESLLPRIQTVLAAHGFDIVTPAAERTDDADSAPQRPLGPPSSSTHHPTASGGASTSTADATSAAPPAVYVLVDQFDEALAWADIALTCSGTAALDLTRAGIPMVVVYATDALPWFLIGRWLLRAPNRALPNLVAGERVIPEYIPHFGPIAPIVRDLHALIESIDPTTGAAGNNTPAARQASALSQIRREFAGTAPDAAAADLILQAFGGIE